MKPRPGLCPGVFKAWVIPTGVGLGLQFFQRTTVRAETPGKGSVAGWDSVRSALGSLSDAHSWEDEVQG